MEWYSKYYEIDIKEFNNHSRNDLSKLKVIKLHFFACSTNSEALDVFDDFHAMPYGHVESGVYNLLDSLRYCKVSSNKLVITDLNKFQQMRCDEGIIDTIVQKLREENNDLISIEPFELVELSHKWFSWRHNFQKARQDGMYSKPISKDLIIREEKFYSLV